MARKKSIMCLNLVNQEKYTDNIEGVSIKSLFVFKEKLDLHAYK